MTKHKPLPSRDELLEHLRYDPETGLFWWTTRGPRRTLSRPAGCMAYCQKSGEPKYIEIRLKGVAWKAHRLAWPIMTGADPKELTIDHINRNPFDNRWENLRLADFRLQMRNQRNRGFSQHKGVCFDVAKGKWRAQVEIDGKNVYLGRFATEDEAAFAAAPYFIA